MTDATTTTGLLITRIGLIAALLLPLRVVAAPGDLDPTFGAAGVVSAPGDLGSASAVVYQPDGKLVAAGGAFSLVRYNADGSLDSTFGSGGVATASVGNPSGSNFAEALVLQSNGQMVAAGWAWDAVSGTDVVLVRYNSDGSLDSTFGSGGIVMTAIGTDSNDYASALILQSDGRLVAAG
jgi:uncharacterized delta-60 repeat protein